MGKFDLKEITEIVKFMDENNLLEVEIEKEGLRLRLKKSSSGETPHQIITFPQPSTDAVAKQEARATAKTPTVEIKAPMVGTFYRAPAPDAQHYVEKGQIIEPGHILCIIEAMKLMNEIKAEAKVKIIDILVENGDSVEFGQPLFLAEPV